MKVIYTLTVKVDGRLDTSTSPELEGALAKILYADKVNDVRFDFADLEYISSSGLRVILASLKKIGGMGGKVHIENANSTVKSILSMTGFDTMLVVDSQGEGDGGAEESSEQQ